MSDTKQALKIASEKKRQAEKDISEFIIRKLAELSADTGLSVYEATVDVTVIETNRMDRDHPEYHVGGVKTQVKLDF